MIIEAISYIRRNDSVMTALVDDELVILNMAGNNYISLDNIGRRIWELLENPCRVDALCRQLLGEFEATSVQIETDVLLFLQELAGDGLVCPVE